VASNEIEPSVENALGELASQRQALGRQNAELEKLKEQRRQLVEDEKRMRDNLAAVGRASITTLSTHIATATAEIETAKEQLQHFVSALTL
jgi:hypothetical protein